MRPGPPRHTRRGGSAGWPKCVLHPARRDSSEPSTSPCSSHDATVPPSPTQESGGQCRVAQVCAASGASQSRLGVYTGARPGYCCRFTHCRASTGRSLAGLSRFFLAHAGRFVPRAGRDTGPRARHGGRRLPTCLSRTPPPKPACLPLCPQGNCPPCYPFGSALVQRSSVRSALQPAKTAS